MLLQGIVIATVIAAWGSPAMAEGKVRAKSVGEYVKAGLVADIKVQPDPTSVLVSVTRKFAALPLDQATEVANGLCTVVSKLSQAKDADPENAVGMCELVLVGTGNKLGSVTFDDGQAVTTWETWWLREKKQR